MSCAVLYFCICQCSRRGPNRDPGFTSVRGMADVAPTDNYGAWLKFAPSCMSDAQWEVAAETPEAVLSHRSCPWGGHLIKIDSKTLGTAWFCIVLHRDTVSRYALMLQDLLCSQLILLCFEHVWTGLGMLDSCPRSAATPFWILNVRLIFPAADFKLYRYNILLIIIIYNSLYIYIYLGIYGIYFKLLSPPAQEHLHPTSSGRSHQRHGTPWSSGDGAPGPGQGVWLRGGSAAPRNLCARWCLDPSQKFHVDPALRRCTSARCEKFRRSMGTYGNWKSTLISIHHNPSMNHDISWLVILTCPAPKLRARRLYGLLTRTQWQKRCQIECLNID